MRRVPGEHRSFSNQFLYFHALSNAVSSTFKHDKSLADISQERLATATTSKRLPCNVFRTRFDGVVVFAALSVQPLVLAIRATLRYLAF